MKEIPRKKLTFRVQPFKVTQSHRKRHGSIGCLWLPINLPWQPFSHLVPFSR